VIWLKIGLMDTEYGFSYKSVSSVIEKPRCLFLMA